jgi:putative oxidoreductase
MPRYLVPVARCLLASIFVLAAPGHFQAQTIGYAAQQGVLFAQVLVPLSGLMALAGGISVLLGWRARLGAWLLVAFLVAVTPTMHAFWAVSDPMMRMNQFLFFMKNVGMLGGLLLIAYWGAGPVSLDERAGRPTRGATSVTAIQGEALPSGSLARGSARRA